MIEDSTQVIPRGGVVRRKRNPFLDEALTGMTCAGYEDRAMVATQLSAPQLPSDAAEGKIRTHASSRLTASSESSRVPALFPFSNETKKR